MACEIEFSDEFGNWWDSLDASEQASIRAFVLLLEEQGVALRFPYCSGVVGSRFGQMRELRVQHEGRPYRVLYAFDPRRMAVLLIGGDKTGQNRWYELFVPLADRIYEGHLAELKREGEI